MDQPPETPSSTPLPGQFGPCPSCQGTGECLTCNGTGLWYADTLHEEKCGSCRGNRRCPRCDGSGLTTVTP